MEDKVKRSKRMAILTENEREKLRGEREFTPKERSRLLNSLLPKIEACIEDINLIWNAVDNQKGFDAWASKNFKELFKLGQLVQIKSLLKLKPSSIGRVKISYKSRNSSKNTRYFYVKTDDGPKQYSDNFSKIEGRYSEIERGNVREDIIKADKKRIIPTNKKDALNITQIRKLLEKKSIR